MWIRGEVIWRVKVWFRSYRVLEGFLDIVRIYKGVGLGVWRVGVKVNLVGFVIFLGFVLFL